MAGASITLLELDDELTALWDAPVHTPALRWVFEYALTHRRKIVRAQTIIDWMHEIETEIAAQSDYRRSWMPPSVTGTTART